MLTWGLWLQGRGVRENLWGELRNGAGADSGRRGIVGREGNLRQEGAVMKALCWYGKEDVRYETVEDPVIRDPTDAIVRITLTAICGSDIHLYDKYMPSYVITHRLKLTEGSGAYKMFRDKEDGCIKVVLRP